ncbi:MAG: hypothetical protein ACXV5N_10890 [Halobacteriota archaeon]
MATEDEFTSHLIEFGLSQKEALLYLHLLRYGPKTPSPLAKAPHSYREDVYRRLTVSIARQFVHRTQDTSDRGGSSSEATLFVTYKIDRGTVELCH